MRQAILVVVLIAASFLGGAFVNGPALNWAQSRVLRSLGLYESAEIASVSLKATSSAENGLDGSQPAAGSDALQEPVAPVPTVISDRANSPDVESPRQGAIKAISKPADRNSVTSRSLPKNPAITIQATQPTKSSPDNSRSERATTTRSSTMDAALAPAVLESAKSPVSDAAVKQLETPSLTDPDLGSPSRPIGAPLVGGMNDWAIVQQKMKHLGVTRFNIEGEPGSRVVFSCLIPLAGRQAVSQRFEAEGDDVLSAALSALRRVALWRATQSHAP